MAAAAPTTQADSVDDAIRELEQAQKPAATERAPTPRDPACPTMDANRMCEPDGTDPAMSFTPRTVYKFLSFKDARATLHKLWVSEYRSVGLRVRTTDCRRASKVRINCTLVMRAGPTRCRAFAFVIRRRDGDRDSTVGKFRCSGLT